MTDTTIIVETPIGKVSAEVSLTPPKVPGVGNTDEPTAAECEIVGDVWLWVDGKSGQEAIGIDHPADILFWWPSPPTAADRRDIKNYVSLADMIVERGCEVAMDHEGDG